MHAFGIDTEHLVLAATRAPSSHNSQPWRFIETADGVELQADELRALLVSDPAWRELVISCGAALLNFRVEAARRGYGLRVEPLLKGERLCLIRRTTDAPDASLVPLAQAITRRHTDRGDFQAMLPDLRILTELIGEAEAEGVRFRPLIDDERQAAASAVREGERRQWADPAWRSEVAWWLRPPSSGDGLSVPAWLAPVVRAVVTHREPGARTGDHDAELAIHSPVLAVLDTAGDTPADWLAAGQALERVLLRATLQGLNASFLSAALEVPSVRFRLAQRIAGSRHLQMLMRLGYPTSDPRTSVRRPLSQVLDPDT
jgi:nitroreductase